MIQVMLVDDELWSRTRLKGLIDWDAAGYHICAEFSDGDSAAQYLKQNYRNVQILITDIRMNKMDGDQLVEIVHKKYPEICMIVLSSYDDYKYVRSTLKNGVLDYLVKNNLNRDVLLEVLNGASDRLGRKTIHPSEDNLRQVKNRFIENLISGVYKDLSVIEERIHELNLNLETRNVTAVLLLLESYRQAYYDLPLKERSLIEFSVQNIVDEILTEESVGIMGSLGNGEFILLLSFGKISSEQTIRQKIISVTKRISFCLKSYLNKSSSFIVGSIGSILDVERSFQKAKEKSRENFFSKEECILFWDENRNIQSAEKEIKLSFAKEQEIQKAVNEKDRQLVQDIIGQLFANIEEERIGRQKCIRLINDLVILSSQICKKNDLELQEVSGLNVDIYEYVLKLERLDMYRDFFGNLFDNIISAICDKADEKDYSIYTLKALKYIKEHYREDISQVDIAENIGISPAYLSTIFKQDTGMGCKEYLLDLKLDYLKQKMEEGGKLKDILKKEGFTNYPYFFKMFKKKYGVTPKEYMKR